MAPKERRKKMFGEYSRNHLSLSPGKEKKQKWGPFSLDFTLVPGEKRSEKPAGVFLWSRAFLPERSAYNMGEPSTQGRDHEAKTKYRIM